MMTSHIAMDDFMNFHKQLLLNESTFFIIIGSKVLDRHSNEYTGHAKKYIKLFLPMRGVILI